MMMIMMVEEGQRIVQQHDALQGGTARLSDCSIATPIIHRPRLIIIVYPRVSVIQLIPRDCAH